MELRDKIVVVTGAAGGIGAAYSARFALEQPRRVVCADLDASKVESLAAEINTVAGRDVAVGRVCDVGCESSVVELIDGVEQSDGIVDVYVANAGVAAVSDPLTDDEVWDRAWRVNTMAHVWAARRLLPAWLERGDGYLVTTGSIGGILTALGDAAYTATKHAAVGFSEWLAITYRDDGVHVSCVCPGGVDTAMLDLFTNRDRGGAPAGVGNVMDPSTLADIVVEGIREELTLILPHAEMAKFIERKVDDYERWVSGMVRQWQAVRPSSVGAERSRS